MMIWQGTKEHYIEFLDVFTGVADTRGSQNGWKGLLYIWTWNLPCYEKLTNHASHYYFCIHFKREQSQNCIVHKGLFYIQLEHQPLEAMVSTKRICQNIIMFMAKMGSGWFKRRNIFYIRHIMLLKEKLMYSRGKKRNDLDCVQLEIDRKFHCQQEVPSVSNDGNDASIPWKKKSDWKVRCIGSPRS